MSYLLRHNKMGLFLTKSPNASAYAGLTPFQPLSHSTPIFKTPISDAAVPKTPTSALKRIRKVLPGTSPKAEQKVQFENDPELEKSLFDATLKVDKYKYLNKAPEHKAFPTQFVETLCKSASEALKLAGVENNFIFFGDQIFIATSTPRKPLLKLKTNANCTLLACAATLPINSRVGSAFICQDLEEVKLHHLEQIICSHHTLASINVNAIPFANRIASALSTQGNDSGIITEHKQPTPKQEADEVLEVGNQSQEDTDSK